MHSRYDLARDVQITKMTVETKWYPEWMLGGATVAEVRGTLRLVLKDGREQSCLASRTNIG